MIYFNLFVNRARFILLSIGWLGAILNILLGESVRGLVNTSVACFLLFVLLTLPRLRLSSILILLFLTIVSWLLLDHFPSNEDWMAAGRYSLIFCGLIPTMALVRSTASVMPSVQRTQAALAALPPSTSISGIQLASHFFGGVINMGVLPIISASIPKDSDILRRQAYAEAALRGMVTSAAWSPFFIAFAVGQAFTGNLDSWIAISLGVVTALIFACISLPYTNKSFSRNQLYESLVCLKPVLFRLTVVLFAVLIVAFLFNYTALSAVILVMPVLVILQVIRNPIEVKSIFLQTKTSMTATADDIIIISAAMIVAFLATRAGAFSVFVSLIYPGTIPGWFALVITPVAMMLASTIGIHPVITSTALLGTFSGGAVDVHPALLMQAHLIGWGAGTMPSIVSLSVITCARLFRVPVNNLCFGQNFKVSFFYALLGGSILSLLNFIL